MLVEVTSLIEQTAFENPNSSVSRPVSYLFPFDYPQANDDDIGLPLEDISGTWKGSVPGRPKPKRLALFAVIVVEQVPLEIRLQLADALATRQARPLQPQVVQMQQNQRTGNQCTVQAGVSQQTEQRREGVNALGLVRIKRCEAE